MPSYSKPEVVLVRYPFSDLTSAKVRLAAVVNATHISQDLFVVALTSKTSSLLAGEFILAEWKAAGLNVETAIKRGIHYERNFGQKARWKASRRGRGTT